jgi:Ribonuclease G/E
MAKELVINQTHSECRIALVENGDIIDFLIDRDSIGKTKPSVAGLKMKKSETA